MNCQSLSQLIITIRLLDKNFSEQLLNRNLRVTLDYKQAIGKYLELFSYNVLKLPNDFLKLVDTEQDATFVGLKAITKNKIRPGISREEFYKAKRTVLDLGKLDGLPNHGSRISLWQYKYFLKKVPEFFYNSNGNMIAAQSCVNSIFLSAYPTSEPLKIEWKTLPKVFQRNFGNILRDANIKIDHVEGIAFPEMVSGEVEIGECLPPTDTGSDSSEIASFMIGGKIRVGAAEKTGIGEGMYDGTIVVDSLVDGDIGHLARGGTAYIKKFSNIEDKNRYPGFCHGSFGGTFLIENIVGNFRFSVGCGAAKEVTLLIKSNLQKARARCYGIGARKDDSNLACYDEQRDVIEYVDSTQHTLPFSRESGYLTQKMLRTGIFIQKDPADLENLDYR